MTELAVTEEEKERQIVAAVMDGTPYTVIADRYRTTYNRVKRIADINGVGGAGHRVTEAEEGRICDLHGKGLSVHAISMAVGRGTEKVSLVLRAHGFAPMGSSSSFWTQDRADKLKALWADGLSASQIKERMGAPSRSAVIGKIHRLGLSARATPRNKPHGGGRPKKPKPDNSHRWNYAHKPSPIRKALSSIPIPAEPLPEARPEDIARVSFQDLTEAMCKFVPGDPTKGHPLYGKKYCGDPVEPGTPYCLGHLSRCYVVYSPRRSPSFPSAQGTETVGGDRQKETVG